MKKIIKYLIIFVALFLINISVDAKENDNITIYLFHGDGCPHCADLIEFLNSLESEYDFDVEKYEVWYNSSNQEFMEEVKNNLNIKSSGVPLTIIGNTYIVGYSDSIGNKIERAIKHYEENEYIDVVEQINNGTFSKEEKVKDKFGAEEKKLDEESTIDVPVIGKVNLKNVSLSTAAVLIGLLDGFNPCAMWVLLFLIGMLISLKDRKKMWIIGSVFLLTSAVVYMLIMLSWLNITVKISTSIWIRNIIAIIALIGGIVNLRGYYKSKDSGCTVVDDKKRKRIFNRIKTFTHEKSLILALIGTVGLAISVNLVELACSAGLPMIFTQLLAMNNITGASSFCYTLLYILFFLLDDILIFIIAMITMKTTGISTKYSKYSHLIGGILMVVIGLLLVFKPEWLMFGNI